MINNKTAILILAALPFYLNDFNNIFIKHELLWLTIDYGAKIIPLAFLFYLLKTNTLCSKDLGLVNMPLKRLILWTLGITIFGLCLDEPGFTLWSKLLPSMRLGSIPIGADSPLYMLDMTLGLALVAIAEEVIFRGLAFTTLKERGYSIPKIFLLSAVIFGLIHWSQGPVAIIATAVTGSGLMICMYCTRSIYPTIIAHYVINYLSFSGKAAQFWGL
ncbi:CPBP family intramembrane glutamic endopeptidase [Maridesulfovibrio sp.]|uniref:CPBP family intramembrane glutamic endopeptidase n=1 Tax=Maridesulfovibrio sp. TaxID=2795000 RepID=UPI0029CA4163|nr:CPBP family intramembrane glutamic endopeptidase [Maridesulfovibrio sp.]